MNMFAICEYIICDPFVIYEWMVYLTILYSTLQGLVFIAKAIPKMYQAYVTYNMIADKIEKISSAKHRTKYREKW